MCRWFCNESDEFQTRIVITDEPTVDTDPTYEYGIFSEKTGACCASTCIDTQGNLAE